MQFITALVSIFGPIIAQCSVDPSATPRGHMMALLSYIYFFWILLFGAFVKQNSLDNIVSCGYILFFWLLAILGYYLNSTSRGALRMRNCSRTRRAVVPVMHLPLEDGEEEDGRTILQGDCSVHAQHSYGVAVAEGESECGEGDRRGILRESDERGGQLVRSLEGHEGDSDRHHAGINEAAESGEESSGADEEERREDEDEDEEEEEATADEDHGGVDDSSSGYSSDEWIDFDIDVE